MFTFAEPSSCHTITILNHESHRVHILGNITKILLVVFDYATLITFGHVFQTE